MITNEKFEGFIKRIIIEKINDEYKFQKNFFSRNRKISSRDIILFVLDKRGMNLDMEMRKIRDITGRMKDVSKSALCQQRVKIRPEYFKDLNVDYIRNSYDNPKDYETVKGYIVMAIDGMKIEIPNTKELRETYGVSKGKEGQRECARALTSCLYDVVNNWVIDAQIDKLYTSERELAKKHIEEMVKIIGDEIDLGKVIIIFDRGYPSIEMMEILEELKIKYIFRGTISKYTEEIKKMTTEDEEIESKITSKKLRSVKEEKIKKELERKGKIKNRYVKNKLETGETEILITNLGKEEFSTEEIGKLYFRRWNIELAYNIAKNKMEIENFSGQNKIVIEQEFHSQIVLLNIAEDLRKEANKEVKAKKENGYKYDYKVNMNTLIGIQREKIIDIVVKTQIMKEKTVEGELRAIIEHIKQSLVPIRPERKNNRKRYKGYNKYHQNHRRNS